MEYHKINSNLALLANIIYIQLFYRVSEYQKELLRDSSYIFAPNHTNNLDGYIIWSLLAKDYMIDTFMYKEFWDNFPMIAKILPYLNIYPITRDSIKIKEISMKLKKLKNPNQSLVIFPQGRHVDPEVMLNFVEYHLRTIPLGAFYMAMKTGKKLVPIYIEPQKLWKKNIVIYGTPIDPNDFSISEKNKIAKENLILFAKTWLTEINKLYQKAELLKGEKNHPYVIEKNYTDATGLDYGKLDDPNRIIQYKEMIEILSQMAKKTSITDIYKLGEMANIQDDKLKEILNIKLMYEKRLIKQHL